VSLTVWGLCHTNPAESYSTNTTVPNDGVWHTYGYNTPAFIYNHNCLQWTVYNNHTWKNLDVDFGTLHCYSLSCPPYP
jgi:hypothetical protein